MHKHVIGSFLLYLIVIGLLGCKSDPLTSNGDEITNEVNDDKLNGFVNYDYKLSSINQTSSNFKPSKFAPKMLIGPEEIRDKIDIITSTNRNVLKTNGYRYFDFNNDGKVDLFGYMNNFTFSNLTGYLPGNYILIDDIHGEFKISKLKTAREFDGELDLNDFDNDGFYEFIVYSQEDHLAHSGDDSDLRVSDIKPLSLIDFDLDGNISERYIGPETSAHNLTSGDIDNDGDIDIVNPEWIFSSKIVDGYHVPQKHMPIFYMNDGNGNFEPSTNNLILGDKFYKDENAKIIRTAIDLFDINNDGYLDIIMGYNSSYHDTERTTCYDSSNNECGLFEYPYDYGIQLIYGDGTGNYDYTKGVFFNQDVSPDFPIKQPLGFSFHDFNNDNIYEIIVVGAGTNYDYGFIEIFEIRQNLEVVDLTDNYFSGDNIFPVFAYGNTRVQNASLLYVNELMITDIDEDGDIDLIPAFTYEGGLHEYQSEFPNSKLASEYTHWEFEDGIFRLNLSYIF
jgi:hypothetical protein